MLEQRGREVLAVRMVTGTMAPRYEIDERLYVDPGAEPHVGDDAYVETARGGFVLEMIGVDQAGVRFRQYAPAHEFTFERAEISRILRVIPQAELFQ